MPPEDDHPQSSRLSRRRFLAASAGLLVLGACGDSSDSSDAPSVDLEPLGGDGLTLMAGFAFQGGYLATGVEQRLVFQLATPDGAPATDVPDSLSFQLSRDGQAVGGPLTVAAHRDGVPLPYYPLRATFDAPGVHVATVELDGTEHTQSFQVDDASTVPLVQPGQQMVPVDTPTVDDHRGVEPYCTLSDPCPLHARTLTDALTTGKPVALLIGTPAYCQTGLCGPVLELLVEQAATRTDVEFVHAEVYRDADAVGGNLAAATVAPVVDAYGLTFEPSLFVADSTGRVVTRLDNVYDRTELVAALDGTGG